MGPRSRGIIELAWVDPAGAPRFRYNYVASSHDRAAMMEGIQIAENLLVSIAETVLIDRTVVEYA
ncbi:GMC oxidoreductase, partial [Rhodococcus sp. IEGM 1409]|uniref:GMC oxidoreductase n=1 Tax=Rhodococcus sp. IEGM 1409 TaxID=3047082 RepID=UPI0024B83C30